MSQAQASRVLPGLVELGVVERREVPPASLFRLVREHVAARALLALARSSTYRLMTSGRPRAPGYDTARVVLDPTRAFGAPIFERGGAKVDDVLGRFWSGELIEDLSAEFGVPASELEDVLRVASRRAA